MASKQRNWSRAWGGMPSGNVTNISLSCDPKRVLSGSSAHYLWKIPYMCDKEKEQQDHLRMSEVVMTWRVLS